MRDSTVESEAADALDAVPLRKWETRDLLVLVAITGIAAALRLVSIEQWAWSPTEAETWRALTQPLSAGGAGFSASPESNFPLAFLGLRWLLENGYLPGSTEGWVRLPFAFVGSLAVPLLALFARPHVGRLTAQLAALTLAIHPGHVAACQTADPVVMASTVALLCGASARERATIWSWLLVVLAGLLHPTGWITAPLLLVVAGPEGSRFARAVFAGLDVAPRFVLVLIALPSLLVAVELIESLRIPVLVLAATAACLRADLLRLLLPAMVLPLSVAGAFSLLGGTAATTMIIAVMPVVIMATAAGCVQAFSLLHASLPETRLARPFAAGATIIVIGELATALFLYFTAFQGCRAPWRDLQNAALRAMRDGGRLHVVAQSGTGVLRSYVRPSHWQEPGVDHHPGRIVEALRIDELPTQLADDNVMLALTVEEWRHLREREDLGETLAPFRMLQLWPAAGPDGDASICLLAR